MAAMRTSATPQQLAIACASVAAAGAASLRVCAAGASGSSSRDRRLADYELLHCASVFLLARSPPRAGVDAHARDWIATVLAEGVRASGVRGREAVLRAWQRRRFPTTVLSITACAADATVKVEYHGGASEVLRCGLPPGGGARPCVLEVQGDPPPETEGGDGGSRAEEGLGGASGVEVLYWAVRFLAADCSRDYLFQRRYLAHDACAFGATGRDAILAANGAQPPVCSAGDSSSGPNSAPLTACAVVRRGDTAGG